MLLFQSFYPLSVFVRPLCVLSPFFFYLHSFWGFTTGLILFLCSHTLAGSSLFGFRIQACHQIRLFLFLLSFCLPLSVFIWIPFHLFLCSGTQTTILYLFHPFFLSICFSFAFGFPCCFAFGDCGGWRNSDCSSWRSIVCECTCSAARLLSPPG